MNGEKFLLAYLTPWSRVLLENLIVTIMFIRASTAPY
jgi:hypothetical protein